MQSDDFQRLHVLEQVREIRQEHQLSPQIQPAASQDVAIEKDVSGIRCRKSREAAQQRGLARAIRPQQRHQGAGFDVGTHLGQHGHAGKLFRESAYPEIHQGRARETTHGPGDDATHDNLRIAANPGRLAPY